MPESHTTPPIPEPIEDGGIDLRELAEVMTTDGEGAAKDYLYLHGVLPGNVEEHLAKGRATLRGDSDSGDGSKLYHHKPEGALKEALNADDVDAAMKVLEGDKEEKSSIPKKRKAVKKKKAIDLWESFFEVLKEAPIPIPHAKSLVSESGHAWTEVEEHPDLEITQFFVKVRGESSDG